MIHPIFFLQCFCEILLCMQIILMKDLKILYSLRSFQGFFLVPHEKSFNIISSLWLIYVIFRCANSVSSSFSARVKSHMVFELNLTTWKQFRGELKPRRTLDSRGFVISFFFYRSYL